MDGGVYPQESSIKSSMVLPTKKSVTYPGDLQDTPAKPPLYHKQPPALPPKPFSRIHSTGDLSLIHSHTHHCVVFCVYFCFPSHYRVFSCFLFIKMHIILLDLFLQTVCVLIWQSSHDCFCFKPCLRCLTCALDYSSLIKFSCGLLCWALCHCQSVSTGKWHYLGLIPSLIPWHLSASDKVVKIFSSPLFCPVVLFL